MGRSWGQAHTCGNENVNMKSRVEIKGIPMKETGRGRSDSGTPHKEGQSGGTHKGAVRDRALPPQWKLPGPPRVGLRWFPDG